MSVREPDTVKVTLQYVNKGSLKHENNKDDMSCTPHGFSLVKSNPSHFTAMKLLVTLCNTCPSHEAKFFGRVKGGKIDSWN